MNILSTLEANLTLACAISLFGFIAFDAWEIIIRQTVENMTMATTMSWSLRNSLVCHLEGSMMNGKNEQTATMPIRQKRAPTPRSTFLFLSAFIDFRP